MNADGKRPSAPLIDVVPGQGLRMLDSCLDYTQSLALASFGTIFVGGDEKTKSLPNICMKRKSLDINYLSKHAFKTIKAISHSQARNRQSYINTGL